MLNLELSFQRLYVQGSFHDSLTVLYAIAQG